MTRYHLNPKTGNPNKCSAKAGNCPFKTEDGAEATHYNSVEEARDGYEAQMDDEAAKIIAAKEAEAEKNWPSPSADTVAEIEDFGYTTNVKGKTLSTHSVTGAGGGGHQRRAW
jgi:hypothetical protein